MNIKFYTKAEAKALEKEINKTPVKTVDGKTFCTIGFVFKYQRGKYLVLRDTSVTDTETFETTFSMTYLGITVTGDSQEDCLLKLVGHLTGALLDANIHPKR